MDLWSEIGRLKEQTLRTLSRNNAFDIVEVSRHRVIIIPHATGHERTIASLEIEGAFNEIVSSKEITRNDIQQQHSSFNPAYVAAILAALPDVKVVSRSPIRLEYES